MSNSNERVAIVGTAQSWTQTPWHDQSLAIWSLNDAYRMPGFQRANAWYDFHPLNRFFYRASDQREIFAHQVPPGYYVRPEGHLDWLASQTMPVYLHEQYLAQHPPAKDWAHARPIPRTQLEQQFGRYFTSSPALMMAHAIQQGVKELHIYGIHLATEHEYIEQRPNFEYLCGRLLGSGTLTETVKDGLRRYETPNGLLVLPASSPVLQSDFRYAVDVRPRAQLERLRWDAHKAAVKRERTVRQLRDLKWWHRRAPLREQLWYLDALSMDVQEQLQRAGA